MYQEWKSNIKSFKTYQRLEKWYISWILLCWKISFWIRVVETYELEIKPSWPLIRMGDLFLFFLVLSSFGWCISRLISRLIFILVSFPDDIPIYSGLFSRIIKTNIFGGSPPAIPIDIFIDDLGDISRLYLSIIMRISYEEIRISHE